jgi:hypothetical protein
VNTAKLELHFPRQWNAEVLPARPAILPARHFVYPAAVDEAERGALEIIVRPEPTGAQPFLATCALGFRDPVVPTGIWSMPRPAELCAVSGGYVYIIDTLQPERFTMLPYRPVLQVMAVPESRLMLFVGHRKILAWGGDGHAWESPKLSDEGVTITGVESGVIQGTGWKLITDKETPFSLDLASGELRKD